MSLTNGTVLKNRWRIGTQLGEGACAVVYTVEDLLKHSSLALVAKCIPLPTGAAKSKKFKAMSDICNTLYYEYSLYRGHLVDFPYRPIHPEVDYYGEDKGVRYLIIQRLDQDLGQFVLGTDNLTTHDIADIGLQMLDGLHFIHNKGFQVNDLKPDNFMIDSSRRLFFIDFGLFDRVSRSGENIPRGQFQGTPTYVSLSVHEGNSPCRHDDLESMGWVLLALSRNVSLPWSNCSSAADCKLKKQSCDVLALASETNCRELGELIMQSRGLARIASPAYDSVRDLLGRMKKQTSKLVGLSTGTAQKAAKQPAIVKSPRTSRVSVPKISKALMTTTLVASADSPSASSSKRKFRTSSASLVSSAYEASEAVKDISIASGGPFTTNVISKDERTLGHKSNERNPQHSVKSIDNATSISTGPFKSVEMDTTLSPKRSRRTQTTKPVDIIQNTKIGPFTSELVATSLFLDPIEGVYCGSRINVSALLKFITLSCGRDETMDISLPKDDCISEKHFSLKMTKLSKGTKLSIRDDNSTNGTKLNGVRISATRWSSLDPGDVIGIGDSKFKLLQI